MSASTEVGGLEAAALKRKARLAELKAKKAKTSGNDDAGGQENKALPKPLFRSYQPIDPEKVPDALILPDAKPGEVVEHVKETLLRENEAVQIEKLDFTNLAPRKVDWDLKRDIAPKLEKLERRTQKAIAELIRERLQEAEAQGEEDLANKVNAGANAARRAAENDDDEE